MRSESKEIYGANVFGLVAMLHQLRRWWAIRELRHQWNQDRYFLTISRKYKHLNCLVDGFSVQHRYKHVRLFAEVFKQKEII
ncbi:hypothetical protein AB7334_18020 [Providencia rettgeri]